MSARLRPLTFLVCGAAFVLVQRAFAFVWTAAARPEQLLVFALLLRTRPWRRPGPGLVGLVAGP